MLSEVYALKISKDAMGYLIDNNLILPAPEGCRVDYQWLDKKVVITADLPDPTKAPEVKKNMEVWIGKIETIYESEGRWLNLLFRIEEIEKVLHKKGWLK